MGQLDQCDNYIAKQRTLKIILITLIAILLTVVTFANEPMCEVYNYDTNKCELFADQNFTINQPLIDYVEGKTKKDPQ